MYVEDMASAGLFLMESYEGESLINVGTGIGTQINEAVGIVKNTVGYKGEIIYDKTKPDGMKEKVLDVSRIRNLGWKSRVTLEQGISNMYKWYLEEYC